MMDQAWQEIALHILVSNAATTSIAQTLRLSNRDADAIFSVTLHGALYCTLEAGRRWIESGRAGVVFSILVSSTITGRAFTTPSAIAKAGILVMTRSLAVEWWPRNIWMVAIASGSFPTAGAQLQLNPISRRTSNDGGQSPVPLGRVGEHRELANLASYLVADAAAYMVGEMVVLGGGLHLRTSGADDLLRWSDKQWASQRDSLKRRDGRVA